ncbi:hypothetical protein Dsin_007670 [Dipteronia sinensis]|uniref:F-box domain-containing protein n=1 Tax=Dipteronia sinensis TaxID=43782 RepID=A0AAE0B1I8_9ROSI|nr:hypothetical protein Dsin_007670 [Dipteronia sinensis]
MSTLLPELIIEILLRLPIKSICRFKCTSKSWLALITHPQFIKMHLARTRKQKLLLCNPYVNAHLCLVDLERSFEDKVHPKVDQLNIKPNIQYVECICGSNGLFYIKFEYHDSSFFICNPSTRESKEILDVPLLNSSYFVGFGYVESIDDYKAVRVFNDQKLLHIFSLRNNSWKIVMGNFPVRQPSFIDGVSLYGAVHWGTLCYPDDLGVITVFDLAEERFKTFPLPISNAPPNPSEYWRCNVYVIGEYLCVTFEVFIDRTTECVEAVDGIWIMKEYGVKESWIRIVKSHGLRDPIPLCLWENDGIILFFFHILANRNGYFAMMKRMENLERSL